MAIKISIVDDHHLILSSIETILDAAGGFELCGAYNNGQELLQALKIRKTDVVIIDYHLPDINGAQLARLITYHYPDIKIIALTGFDKPGLATEMLESGCAAYLLKTSAKKAVLLDAIHAVCNGMLYLDKSLKERFASDVQLAQSTVVEEAPKLTTRELEILELIADEKSSQEIADRLFISKKTVDNHRSSILMKTGVKSTLGLVKFAWELKLHKKG